MRLRSSTPRRAAGRPLLIAALAGGLAAPPVRVDADLQGFVNPGMNAGHGPTVVAGVRLHAHI